MKLEKDEKEYLFKKIEYKKKKLATETKNELYNLLKGDKVNFTDDEFNLILKSLEFKFRKKLMSDDDTIKDEKILSIKKKIPENISLVKYSNINKKPSKSSNKAEIISYLKRKGIKYNTSDTKQKLISLVEGKTTILKFNEF